MNRKSRLRTMTVVLGVGLALALTAAGWHAAYMHITPGYEFVKVAPSNTQAGGHPDLDFNFKYRYDDETECPSECLFPRYLIFDMPEGFIGNPHVTSQCPLSDYASQKCPSDSQVGVFQIQFGPGFEPFIGVYNLRTRPDQAGLLAFTAPVAGLPFLLELKGRTNSDYGLRSETSPILRLPLPPQRLILWGVPAAHVNDKDRFQTPLKNFGFCGHPVEEGCAVSDAANSATFAQATSPPAPFLQNPTVCGQTQFVDAAMIYFGNVEDEYGGVRSDDLVPWPAMSGCNQASFSPSIVAKPTTSSADTASGLDTDLKVPQTQSPDTPAPSEIRKVRLTLPGRLLDQPERGGRQGRLPGRAQCDRDARRGDLSRVLEDRHAQPRCRGPAGTDPGCSLPGGTEAGRTVPRAADRRRLRDPRQAARHGRTRPQNRPALGHLRPPAAVAPAGVRSPRLRLGAWAARDADTLRNVHR